jgi:hypothetical protein
MMGDNPPMGFFFPFLFNKYDGAAMVKWIALMNIHRDIPLSTEQIIDEYSVKARRMNFRIY